MIRLPPKSTRTDTLFPYTTLFRSVRDRSGVTSPTLRKPEMLPTAEIRQAVLEIITANYGAGSHDLVLAVSRGFGFLSTSAPLSSEEHRVGNGWVSPCISRWSPYHSKHKIKLNERD